MALHSTGFLLQQAAYRATLNSGSFDPLLVVLSLVIAVLASYAALALVRSLFAARGLARHVWWTAGSLAMGLGIWSMHFVGMLAFSIPGQQIAYAVLPLALSLLFAIGASSVALFAATREKAGRGLLAGAGAVMAVAISGMHYIAVSGMRVAARVTLDPLLVGGSVLVALAGSLAALWLAFSVGRRQPEGAFWSRLGGAFLLGLAIGGMHYTAMAAMTLEPTGTPLRLRGIDVLDTYGLALAVGGTSLLLLSAALAGSMVDRALARRERMAEESARLYRDAEEARSEYEARTSELEETTEILQALIRSAPLAVVELGREGAVRTWNPAAERLFGWHADEVVGRSVPIVPAEMEEEHARLREAALSGESIANLETKRRRKDGSVVDVAVSVSPLRGEGGSVRGLISMYSDIGDRKRAEEERVRLLELERAARREAERSTGKREALAELGQRALAGADAEVLMHEAVRVVADRLQVEYTEVLELLEGGESLLVRAGVGWKKGTVGSAAVPAGRDSQAGYTLLSRGAVIVEDLTEEERFAGAPLLARHGIVSGVSVIIEGRTGPWGVFGAHSTARRQFTSDDIAFVQAMANILAQAVDRRRVDEERKTLLDRERLARGEAERRAREEAALRQATEAVTATFTIDEVIHQIAESALTATDADGAFVCRIDARLERVEVVARAGRSTPEIGTGTGYPNSVAERVVRELEPLLLDAAAEAATGSLDELIAACGDCSVMMVPLVDAGEAIGALALVRQVGRPAFQPDEVGRARTFGELAALAFRKVHLLHESERRREELERVTESRARLIRGFSHDVKNPLGAADGYLDLLDEGIVDISSGKGKETVTRIRRAIRSALDLIDDLVDLAQAESGQIELQLRPIDVRELTREMVEEYRAQGEGKGLGVRLVLSRAVPRIRSDPARVRQILGNLVSNAIKYTDEGQVRVEVREETRGPDGSEGHWIATRVRDSGPGIPRQKLDLLFREFSRLGTEKEGVGLGLAISRRVAEALGGDITLESVVGEGSTFCLWLPAQGRFAARERDTAVPLVAVEGRGGAA